MHRDIAQDERLRDQWNALVFQMECPEVFYTWEWATAAGRAYASLLKPLLILAYEGEALVGVGGAGHRPCGEANLFFGGKHGGLLRFHLPS